MLPPVNVSSPFSGHTFGPGIEPHLAAAARISL